MGGDKMSHSPYLDSCNMIEKSFFSDKAPIYNKRACHKSVTHPFLFFAFSQIRNL